MLHRVLAFLGRLLSRVGHRLLVWAAGAEGDGAAEWDGPPEHWLRYIRQRAPWLVRSRRTEERSGPASAVGADRAFKRPRAFGAFKAIRAFGTRLAGRVRAAPGGWRDATEAQVPVPGPEQNERAAAVRAFRASRPGRVIPATAEWTTISAARAARLRVSPGPEPAAPGARRESSRGTSRVAAVVRAPTVRPPAERTPMPPVEPISGAPGKTGRLGGSSASESEWPTGALERPTPFDHPQWLADRLGAPHREEIVAPGAPASFRDAPRRAPPSPAPFEAERGAEPGTWPSIARVPSRQGSAEDENCWPELPESQGDPWDLQSSRSLLREQHHLVRLRAEQMGAGSSWSARRS
ncbi:MAG TPA: hypothetical protein VFU23_08615 [Gemmatimonadales bacterium]|nr:hypothetical protein [Gemmatimonadales bacterium]